MKNIFDFLRRLTPRHNIVVAALTPFIVFYTLANLSLTHGVPYLVGTDLYTFRDDNFWSYTSGFYRRGLPGELLLWLNNITDGAGPILYSSILMGFYLVVLTLVLRSLIPRHGTLFLFLLCVSPIMLFFRIDSEVFLLLPFALICLLGRSIRLPILMIFVVVSIAVRETAFLIYLPIILRCFTTGSILDLLLGFFAIAIFAIFILILPENLTYQLENHYWPIYGIENLTETYLYNFAGGSLQETLYLHLHFISKNILLGGWSLAAFFIFVLGFIYSATKSVPICTYFALLLLVMGILTVDYGRYYYLFFFCAVFLSYGQASSYMELRPLVILVRYLSMEQFLKRGFVICERHKTTTLTLLCLAPTGFWIGEVDPIPRFIAIALWAM